MTQGIKMAFVVSMFASLFLAEATLAHHAFAAEFDKERPVRLTGRVTEMRWANPHAWIYIDVEGENGDVVNWALETRGANNLIRMGWRPADLTVGTILEVQGFRARNNTPTANLREATLPDGRRLFSGSPD